MDSKKRITMPQAVIYAATVLALAVAFAWRYEVRPDGHSRAAYVLDRWTGKLAVCWQVETGGGINRPCRYFQKID
jgi:hypothetical protein